MAACRALHWRTAQLRAHGIEPDTIAPDAPHDPPADHVFDSVRNRGGGEAALAIGEHAFRAGWAACDATMDDGLVAVGVDAAWLAYDPPEHIKELS